MTEHLDVVVIGAGQAGLSTGYYLSKLDKDYIILEQGSASIPSWRGRWDSFTLVLPNWTYRMPEHAYKGDDPDGFMGREELVASFDEFTDEFHPEIRFNTRVTKVERNPQGADFMISTTDGIFLADNVVVASGTYQEPRIPAFSKNLSEELVQLHTNEYRNPGSLPDGGVLVVGTGQSGCQIAEEIYQSGRKVYLCVGGATRIPRRYRGKDSIYWLEKMDFFDQKADSLENSKERFKANPYVSGKNGGHSLNLHQFAKDGVTLLGHMKGAQGSQIYLIPDLKENLAKIDQFVVELKQGIDQYIEKHNIDAEDEPAKPVLKAGYELEIITELDLYDEGIQTVIWATGYKFDFSWVDFPIFDQDGYPIQDRGVSEYPGLYFVGLHFLYKRKSGLLLGVAEIANHVAEDIALRR